MSKGQFRIFCVLATVLSAPVSWAALEIVGAPTLTMDPNGVAPLSGLIEVATNIPSEATLEVTDGIDSWRVRFPDSLLAHSLPLLGLKPDSAYDVNLILSAPGETSVISPLLATTDPLPADFPAITVLASDPIRMEPGFTLTDCLRRDAGDARTSYTIAVDARGELVWYLTRCLRQGIQQLPNGNIIHKVGNTITETDMLGADVKAVPTAYPGDPGTTLHHDLHLTPYGTYLSLSRTGVMIDNFPTSDSDPTAPTATTLVRDEPVVEFAADGSLLNEWLLTEIIDPTRIGYNSLVASPQGVDWAHCNAVVYDPQDDSLVVSARHQDAVFKFSRATGELKWILASPSNWGPAWQPYLLQPVGAPFEWSWHQHAPMYTAAGTIVMFDNGTVRASPFDGSEITQAIDNWSRAVEYEIDETNMEVRQVWEYGKNIAVQLMVTFQGDADWMPTTDNTLLTYSAVIYAGGVVSADLGLGTLHARIVEADHGTPAREVFDLQLHDPDGARITVYRSERIPSLYGSDVVVETIDPVLAAPGMVLDGLRVDQTASGEVVLTWGSSCITSDTDYEIYEGQLGDFTSHAPAFCSTGGATTKTFAPFAGDWYYLVVPTNGVEEGSYGAESGGTERPQGTSVCLGQAFGVCP